MSPKNRKLNEVTTVLLDPSNLVLILPLNNACVGAPSPKTLVYFINVSLVDC